MSLTQIIDVMPAEKHNQLNTVQDYSTGINDYGLFCEQYLEKPVISGDDKMARSPTSCTIKGVTVTDDF